MNYYIDTEFLEGNIPQKVCGFNIPKWLSKPNNTIQPISVGLISDDNREYYAISKDFNLYEAWNRYDEKINNNYNSSKEESHYNPMYIKEYWIREKVLKPIFYELINKDINFHNYDNLFTYKYFKELINKYGKTNKQIANEIIEFTKESVDEYSKYPADNNIKLYGYYSDYDHVVLCQLFGKMIDLPKGFPMYTIDLKQELDNKVTYCKLKVRNNIDGFSEREYYIGDYYKTRFEDMINYIKKHKNYPKQTNKHNALSDAIFNKELHNFLKTL